MTKHKTFWLEAKEKIDRFNRIDSDAEIIFGSEGHRYQIRPTIDNQEIDEIESAHNFSLPAELKAYLLYFGAGGAGPGYGVKSFKSIFDEFSSDKPFVPPKIDEYGDYEPIENFSGLVYFGTEGCGADYYLELLGDNVGRVWITWSSGDSCSNLGDFTKIYSNWISKTEKTINEHAKK